MPAGLAQHAADFFVLAARDSKTRLAVETYVGESYVQHNHRVPDGPEGFRKRYHDMSHDYGYRDVAVIRSFASADTAVLHTLEDRGDGGVWVGMVLLRFVDDKVVEQWDNYAEVADLTAGLAAVSGPAAVSTLESTDDTANRATETIRALVANQPMSAAPGFDHRKFRHHDNGEASRTFAAEWFENRDDLEITTIHQVVAHHSFALVQSEGRIGDTPTAFTDLFRCEQGLIIEHWGIAENIASTTDSAHSNGKF